MSTVIKGGTIAVGIFPFMSSRRGLSRTSTRSLITAIGMAFVAASFAPTPSYAQRNLTSILEVDPAQNSASLQLYQAVCSDNPECIIATLSCSDRGHFEFDMTGFGDNDVGHWLLLNGGLVTLKNGSNMLPLRPTAIEANDMDGGWSISFLPSGSWERWLAAYKADFDIVISNIQDDLVVPKGEGDLTDLIDFIQFCRSTLRG
jgi:hypothetical protein